MASVSAASARRLCGLFEPPRMGFEVIVASHRNAYGVTDRLRIQNFSGSYYLTCSSVPVSQWADVFDITVKRCAVAPTVPPAASEGMERKAPRPRG